MIYGATGFSGRLIAEEAVRRGHRPLLAGRSAEKLAPLADRLGLEYAAFSLDDLTTAARAIKDVDLVFHAAGPFIHTADTMLRACVVTSRNYIDITGEYPVLENTFSYDATARRLKVAFISGAGFDVVPSDCLAGYVAARVPDATHLEIAITSITRLSAGTVQSGLALAASGGLVRRDGHLQAYPLGSGGKKIPFSHGEQFAIPIPWGDLVTAYQSTGIPNITTYMGLRRPLAYTVQVFAPLAQPFLGSRWMQKMVGNLFAHRLKTTQGNGASLWARATNAEGESAQAWMSTAEPYQFTARAGVRMVERVLSERPTGALTPAQAFGVDFALEIEGTRRIDTAP